MTCRAAATVWEILKDAGIDPARWTQACRHELLDRTLVWNQAHHRHLFRAAVRRLSTLRKHRLQADGSWRDTVVYATSRIFRAPNPLHSATGPLLVSIRAMSSSRVW
jgi:hypothetical protein